MAVTGLTLRPYQPSDFESLLEIDQACFPKRIAYGRIELRMYLRSPGAACVVAQIDERFESSRRVPHSEIAGFILTERSDETAHIITLDVLEPFRRISIGSRLLEAAERDAASKGADRMYLETATTNEPAIALWKKHGYRETGTIEHYYGWGLHAFEMQKLLRHSQEDRIP